MNTCLLHVIRVKNTAENTETWGLRADFDARIRAKKSTDPCLVCTETNADLTFKYRFET